MSAPRELPSKCECDNTHEQNDTVCRYCWAQGRRSWGDAMEVARLGPLYVTIEEHEDVIFLDCWHRDLDEGLATVKLVKDEDGMHRLRLISSALQGEEQQDVWDEGLV